MLRAIPLLIVVVALYNILALLTDTAMTASVFALSMPSGDGFSLSTAELLLGMGLLLLYLELLKATRTSSASVVDHVLSMALFVVALLEFLLLPGFGTGAFGLIVLLTLIDVVAGFTITISTARRDIGFGGSLN
jgi:hypothetical protein